MPRFDGTGPLGFGPGTGWGLGPCGAGIAWRRGRGFGRRRFFGWPGFYYPEKITKKEELGVLEDEAKVLQEELKEINKRISELKGQR